jgi:hypothetical protein
MAFGAGRLAGGRNQDEFRLSHLFLQRRRRLREVSLRSGVSSCPLLRICGMLKGVIMRLNVVSVAVPWAHRGLFGGRSEMEVEVNIV